MKKGLVFVLSIFAFAAWGHRVSATGKSPRYNHQAIIQFLESQGHFKPLVIPEAWEPKIADTPLPKEIHPIFDQINKVVFGGAIFRMAPCVFCFAALGVESRTVFLDPDFLEDIADLVSQEEWRNISAYIIAHEIAHYFYEVAVLENPQGLSPSGYISYAKTKANRRSEEAAHAHSEVDIIAFHLMSRAGISRPADQALLFHHLVEKYRIIGEPDFYHRVDAAQEFAEFYHPSTLTTHAD